MKEVWVFRHGPKERGQDVIAPEVGLTPEGIELMKKVVQMFLKKERFKKIYTSPFVRCYQSGVILALYLELDFPIILPELASDNLIELKKFSRDPSFFNVLQLTSDFWERRGKIVFEGIRRIAQNLSSGEKAIAVGHGELIKPALGIVLARKEGKSFKEVLLHIPDLKEGEGIVFVFSDNNKFLGYEEKRFPT